MTVSFHLAMQPEQRLLDYLNGKRIAYPAHMNRASAIGHPCVRYLVYMRTAWEMARPPDIRVQGIFLFGTDYEIMLRQRLTNAGYRFRQPSRPMLWKELQLTGTDDGDISFDDGETWHLIEIKGLHPYFYDKVREWRDFLSMSHIYAKYPAQLQIYMKLNERDHAFFLLGRKGSYDVKFLPVEPDEAYLKELKAKARLINRHVKRKTLPDKLEDIDVCDDCEYREHCRPNVYYGEGAWIWDSTELVQLLEERERLAVAKSEATAAYEKVQKRIKRQIGEMPVAMAGSYQITQKEVERPPQEASRYTRMQVKNLAKPRDDPEESLVA